MENEIWKDVVGLEGFYKVSNLGRVLNANTKKIRKLVKDKDGYYQLVLMKNGKRVYPKVHRLVAEAFLKNPDLLPVVNHKNENKTDNRPEKLEWCTTEYNNSYGSRVRGVLQFNLDGSLVKKYQSISSAAKENKMDIKTLYRWCQKVGGIGCGYKWYFEDEMIGG